LQHRDLTSRGETPGEAARLAQGVPMRLRFWIALSGVVALLSGGCMSGPLRDNPGHYALRSAECPNPIYVPQRPAAYGLVFEQIIDVLAAYFEIAYANRYDGRIETFPRIAPGLEQPWKPGSPDFAQRLLATLQTIRHRGMVLITPAEDGGFFIDVKVYKELEDLDKPTRQTAGAAPSRSDNTVERQFEVIDATIGDSHGIPLGRDLRLEQVILKRLACYDVRGVRPAGEPAGPQTPPPAVQPPPEE